VEVNADSPLEQKFGIERLRASSDAVTGRELAALLDWLRTATGWILNAHDQTSVPM